MAKVKEKLGGLLARMRGQDVTGLQLSRKDREQQLAQISSGFTEVSDTMRSVRTHLTEQSDRSAEMMDMMKGLPEVLRTIPEATRVQTQLIKTLSAQLESSNTNSAHLTEALQGLNRTADKQEETLGSIAKHLSEESMTKRELNTGIVAMTSTLESVEASNLAARQVMTDAQEQQRRSEERMMQLYRRSQFTTGLMLLISALLATGAVGVAVWFFAKSGAAVAG